MGHVTAARTAGARAGVRKERQEFRNGNDALYDSTCDLKQQMASNGIPAGSTEFRLQFDGAVGSGWD